MIRLAFYNAKNQPVDLDSVSSYNGYANNKMYTQNNVLIIRNSEKEEWTVGSGKNKGCRVKWVTEKQYIQAQYFIKENKIK